MWHGLPSWYDVWDVTTWVAIESFQTLRSLRTTRGRFSLFFFLLFQLDPWQNTCLGFFIEVLRSLLLLTIGLDLLSAVASHGPRTNPGIRGTLGEVPFDQWATNAKIFRWLNLILNRHYKRTNSDRTHVDLCSLGLRGLLLHGLLLGSKSISFLLLLPHLIEEQLKGILWPFRAVFVTRGHLLFLLLRFFLTRFWFTFTSFDS